MMHSRSMRRKTGTHWTVIYGSLNLLLPTSKYLFSSFKRINVYFIVHLQIQKQKMFANTFQFINFFHEIKTNTKPYQIECKWKWTQRTLSDLNPSTGIRQIRNHFTISVISVMLMINFSLSLSPSLLYTLSHSHIVSFACFYVFNFVSVGFQQLENQHMADKKNNIHQAWFISKYHIFFRYSPSLALIL